MRRLGLAKRVALHSFGGWLVTALALAGLYRYVLREAMELPVVLALGFGLFVVTPALYVFVRRYERLEE